MDFTEEQQTIIDYNFDKNDILLINALAGTGKTTTLVEFCRKHTGKKILYLCYNRALREEAQIKFQHLGHVQVSTIHSIAYRYMGAMVGKNYRNIKLGNLRSFDLAVYFTHSTRKYEYGYFVLCLLRNFCNSSNTYEEYIQCFYEISQQVLKGFHFNAQILEKAFERIWLDITEKHILFMEHDVYLKLFQLSRPNLSEYDYILIDEAQDINSCMLDIVMHSKSKKIFIGDEFQQLYQWRGSVNVFHSLRGNTNVMRMSLTGSFRCAKNIVIRANKYLEALGSSIFMESLSRQRTNLDNYTIIGRTNAKIIAYIIEHPGKVFYIGGSGSYDFDLLQNIDFLYHGKQEKITHTFIKMFHQFQDLQNYADTGNDQEIRTMIKVFLDYLEGRFDLSCRNLAGKSISDLIQQIKSEATNSYLYSDYAVSSAHKAKGLEWVNVVLLDDFVSLKNKIQEIASTKNSLLKKELTESVFVELYLLYVAVTRAKQNIVIPEAFLITEMVLKEWLGLLNSQSQLSPHD